MEAIHCDRHSEGYTTFVCCHLHDRSTGDCFRNVPTEDDRWPDAWCGICQEFYRQQGEWNDISSEGLVKDGPVRVLCHHCYEELLSRLTAHSVT